MNAHLTEQVRTLMTQNIELRSRVGDDKVAMELKNTKEALSELQVPGRGV